MTIHSRILTRLGVAVLTCVLFIGGPATAWAAESIYLTLVRHAQTTTNAAHVLDTKVPGPSLSATGIAQAEILASILAADGIAYDGVYASTMVRTQQTAQPLAEVLGQNIVVLDGLQEINAGIYEGVSTKAPEFRNYVNAQTQWMLGDRVWQLAGSTDSNGYVFDARVDAAIQQIYDSGDLNPVVFSHRGTITSWTMMNVRNPDVQLALRFGLTNTGVVVMTGNPTDGWTLQSWNGVPVNPNPTLETKLFVDFRDFLLAPQTALYNVQQALQTGDLRTIVVSVVDGLVAVVKAAVELPIAVVRDVVDTVVEAVRGDIPIWPDWDAGPVPTGAPAPAAGSLPAPAPRQAAAQAVPSVVPVLDAAPSADAAPAVDAEPEGNTARPVAAAVVEPPVAEADSLSPRSAKAWGCCQRSSDTAPTTGRVARAAVAAEAEGVERANVRRAPGRAASRTR